VKTGNKVIPALTNATGLTLNEAKTIVYWVIATYGLKKLDCFPPLVIYGPPETGKSTILKFVTQLVNGHVISTTSRAEFRDQLVDNRIVCIEEGDEVDEALILKRYSRESGQVHIKVRGLSGYQTN
jgi:Cdc6-like AAA superfamily ATPase